MENLEFNPGDLVYVPHRAYFARVINVISGSYGGINLRLQKIFHIDGNPSKRQKRFVVESHRWVIKMDQDACDEWAGRIKSMIKDTHELNEQDDPRLMDI